jgi:hypothetical protein
MASNEVKTEFLVRYFWWAKEDMKREIREGFPLLGALKDGTCGVAFNFFNHIHTQILYSPMPNPMCEALVCYR